MWYSFCMGIISAIQRWMQKDDQLSWSQHRAMLHSMYLWEKELSMCPALPETNGDVTAYVANFARPQNIQCIVQSLLACPSIQHIIVSNNNPQSPLLRWFQTSSHRVTVLHHPVMQSCQKRFEHVSDHPAPYYLILDDDIFLYPHQIEQLITALRTHPHVPHGLFGQRWKGDQFEQGIKNQEGEIDVINRVYAFTEAQRTQSLQLADTLKKESIISDRALGWCDDIMLSCSNASKPYMHDVGPFIDCPTQGKKGVATWREDDFFVSRKKIYQYIQSIQR